MRLLPALMSDMAVRVYADIRELAVPAWKGCAKDPGGEEMICVQRAGRYLPAVG
ncbi:MAG: hypothetical protein ACTXOO_03945 [Sodalis sp. (in: enterobacteria)]